MPLKSINYNAQGEGACLRIQGHEPKHPVGQDRGSEGKAQAEAFTVVLWEGMGEAG